MNGVVELLLAKGADVDKARQDGATPLHVACRKGHESVVRLLLESGANPHLVSVAGVDSFAFAASQPDILRLLEKHERQEAKDRRRCVACGKTGTQAREEGDKLRRCKRCMTASFCSKACLEAAWRAEEGAEGGHCKADCEKIRREVAEQAARASAGAPASAGQMNEHAGAAPPP